MILMRTQSRILASFLALMIGFFYCGVSQAIVISTDTTWTDPADLNDSLTINPGATLFIVTTGNNGGNLTINLPNGGSFIVQNGGIIDLSAQGMGGNGGNLTVNLAGAIGTVNVAGIIDARGLGSGAGGNVLLNGSTYSLASTGRILALAGSATGQGGAVTLNNPSGIIGVPNGFVIMTQGIATATDNVITIDGIGVNVSGILNASGLGTADGGKIVIDGNTGAINILGTGNLNAGGDIITGSSGGTIALTNSGASAVTVNGLLNAGGTKGLGGGTISITASGVGGDIAINGGGRLAANSGSNGSNIGFGGNVNLTANDNVSIQAINTGTVINVNGSEAPSTTGGNGAGGNVIISAGNNVSISATTGGANSRGVIEANGAALGSGSGGMIQVKQGNNVSISGAAVRPMLLANGGTGATASVSGNGGQILLGTGAGSSALTGNINVTNAVLYTAAGNTESTANGDGGTIAFSMAGDYNGTNASVQSIAGGNGAGGTISVVSSAGDITLNDINTYFQNWTDNTGSVTLSANNITNNGTIASRAARVAHATPAPNANSGGTVNITASGILTNNGDINASAWSPSLESISTGDESTGHGGFININANSMTNNGSAAEERAGRIYAHGGLNTVGAIQGNGGRVHINVTNNFTDNAFSKIDSRGNPVNPTNFATGENRVYINAGSMDINGRVNASGFYANDAGGYVELRTTGGNMNLNSGSLVSASGGIGDVFNNLGNGGVILLNATGDINVNGSVNAIGTGGFNGGAITATATGNVNVLNTGQINSSSELTGNGGTININGAQLSINTTTATAASLNANGGATSGNGGTITIGSGGSPTAVVVNSTVGGTTDAIVSAEGTGGRIEIYGTNADFTNTANRLMLSTDANGSDGGVIVVNTTGYLNMAGEISSQGDSVAGGNGGNVVINSTGNIVMDANINTSGSLAAGGSAGSIDMTSSAGDITLNGDLTARGFVVSAAQTAVGGPVTLNANGNFTMNSTSEIRSDSFRSSGSADIANMNGGNVSIIAGTDITINNPGGGAYSIYTNGVHASTGGGANHGGNAGNITLTAGNNIDLNSSSNRYFQALGGNGKGQGDGGNGGNVTFTHGGALTIDNFNVGNNFDNTGGKGKPDGADGTATSNGSNL